MENFHELASCRQSDRAYTDQAVEKEKIERILSTVRLSPSACNAQPWKFIVVDNAELKNKIADATSNKVLGMNHFTKQAPVHIVVIEEKANFTSNFGAWIKKTHFPHIDLGIATAHLCLSAADEGLGTCIMGWFDEKKVKELLHIPKSRKVALIITLGYSAQTLRKKQRKEMSEIVAYNSYNCYQKSKEC